MDVCVGVEKGVVGGDDGVPDYCFGGWDSEWVRRWKRDGDVEEDLLRVPVEEGGEIFSVVSCVHFVL